MGLEYINIIKKKRGITSEELSAKSGVPLGTLNKILAGQTADPKFETLRAICNALNISLNDLDSYAENSDEVEEYLEYLHKRPEMKMLFRASKNASKEQIEHVVKMIESFAPQDNDEGC